MSQYDSMFLFPMIWFNLIFYNSINLMHLIYIIIKKDKELSPKDLNTRIKIVGKPYGSILIHICMILSTLGLSSYGFVFWLLPQKVS